MIVIIVLPDCGPALGFIVKLVHSINVTVIACPPSATVEINCPLDASDILAWFSVKVKRSPWAGILHVTALCSTELALINIPLNTHCTGIFADRKLSPKIVIRAPPIATAGFIWLARTRRSTFGWGYLRLDHPLQSGMAITIEPGFYQVPALLKDPTWAGDQAGLFVDWATLEKYSDVRGIRIEDDLLITDTGAEILSEDIPREPEQLSKLWHS